MRKMKDSGIDWIGAIPKDWNECRLRFLCTIQTGNMDTQDRVPDGKYPFYVRSPIVERSSNYTFDGEAVLMAGDGVGAGKVFHYVTGKYACHQRVYSLSNFNKVNAKYLFYYLSENFWRKIEESNAKSTVDSVRLPMLREFVVVYPDMDAQQSIVQYLDGKCAEIDDIIAKHNQIIEKLKIYKSSYISEILSNESYRTVTLRYCIDLIEQGSSPSPATEIVENGWKVLSLAAVKCGIFYADATKHIDTADSSERLRIKDGDFLMTRSNTRELVGDVCIVRNCPENTIFSDLIYRITFKDTIIPEYACYALRSASARQQIQEAARGSSGSMPKISHKSIKEIKIPVPSLDEQEKIVAILDDKCNKIDVDIAKRQQLIDKLTECKKSLIFEVVTGKKEV